MCNTLNENVSFREIKKKKNGLLIYCFKFVFYFLRFL